MTSSSSRTLRAYADCRWLETWWNVKERLVENKRRLPSRHGSFVRALGCEAQRSVFLLFARSLRLQVGNPLDTHANLVTSLEMHPHVIFSTPFQSTCYTLR